MVKKEESRVPGLEIVCNSPEQVQVQVHWYRYSLSRVLSYVLLSCPAICSTVVGSSLQMPKSPTEVELYKRQNVTKSFGEEFYSDR